MKLAACIILYNPDENLRANIESYMANVDYLMIIDNSPDIHNLDFSFLYDTYYEYISNGGNVGIAVALNIAAKKAIEKGYDWLLTMDQDSSFETGATEILKQFLQLSDDVNNIGIIAPSIKDISYFKQVNERDLIYEPLAINTSGNILNLKAWEEIGGFNEKLFIDSVDTDLCLRLKMAGYKIFVINSAFLNHAEGDMKEIAFFWSKILISRHNHIRRYYITRNRSFIIVTYYKQFPKFCRYLFKAQLSEFGKTLLFEKNKVKKISSFFLGFKDFLFKKYGKYDY